mmetsp:Transcript_42927/g.98547  ORF Transcript_42927/g.98547 Transcript_42927/m.98547 type:complete len:111 (-) Transcript_42927:1264-1596(-)
MEADLRNACGRTVAGAALKCCWLEAALAGALNYLQRHACATTAARLVASVYRLGGQATASVAPLAMLFDRSFLKAPGRAQIVGQEFATISSRDQLMDALAMDPAWIAATH